LRDKKFTTHAVANNRHKEVGVALRLALQNAYQGGAFPSGRYLRATEIAKARRGSDRGIVSLRGDAIAGITTRVTRVEGEDDTAGCSCLLLCSRVAAASASLASHPTRLSFVGPSSSVILLVSGPRRITRHFLRFKRLRSQKIPQRPLGNNIPRVYPGQQCTRYIRRIIRMAGDDTVRTPSVPNIVLLMNRAGKSREKRTRSMRTR